jgi:uncharacterized membrane protein
MSSHTTRRPPRKRQPRILRRLLHLHAKLLTCLAIGIALIFLLPGDWPLTVRLLSGWDTAIASYLAFVGIAVASSPIERIKRRAAIQDEGAIVVLILTMIAVFASLAALIILLGTAKGGEAAHPAFRLTLATGTIVLSWLFMHTTFTLHYAHEYYGDWRDRQTGGLTFPGSEQPDYWDFLYFSLVIGMTSQVSDVAISSKVIRRIATLHGVLSFFFNLGILALTINMLADFIS